jgi:hypothetical protein
LAVFCMTVYRVYTYSMKHKTLQDAAKFLAGLILGDFLTWWWLAANHGLPIEFLGMSFTSAAVAPAMLFDAALFIFLIYYGWHLGKLPAVRERTYFLIAGVIFGVVALAHLLRVMTGTSIVLLNWNIPLWLSWIATAVSAILSYMSFHFALTRKR